MNRRHSHVDQAETRLLQFSVVLAGKVHNPSILNPDFLRLRSIVPDEWGWEVAEGGLTTPPLALVPYKQGTVITVEHEKLQVVDGATQQPSQSKAAEIAHRYVQTLPHVRYTAVGINFQAAIAIADPRGFLKERFLKPGSWDSERHVLQALGLRFVYPLSGGRMVASLDVGEVSAIATNTGEEPARPAVIVGANFHRDCSQYPADKEVIQHLSKASECWQEFLSLMRDILDVDWRKNVNG
jgi:hypothetical protein